MKRRDLAFLFIGTGVGLTLGTVLFLSSFIWMHHMFIFGFSSYIAPVLAALLPFGMIASGAALLMKERRAQ
jgi:apolipoprotein N-acyltransferase